jgi:alkaline phosphatase
MVLLLGDRVNGQDLSSVTARPKNIILMIGDGMGTSQLSAAYYYGDGEPAFDRFRYIGLTRTSSGTHVVTQSSAAATALGTGQKTYNTAIGVGLDSLPVPNIVEIVSEKGFLTGVVATSSVTHATPAGFYAHQVDRTMEHEIGMDLVRSEIDFFAGGGIRHFIDTTGIDYFKANGIQVNFSKLKKIRNPEPGNRYGFLLADDRMQTMAEGRGDFLSRASLVAAEFLSSGNGGFFLMIEGSQIDWACHGNQVEYMIEEVNDFEATVDAVLDWAEEDGETLVIVTADHETGGFTLGAAGSYTGGTDYGTIVPTFATTNHSAALVPVFAFGPGAEIFTGVYENTAIFHKMVSLLPTD